MRTREPWFGRFYPCVRRNSRCSGQRRDWPWPSASAAAFLHGEWPGARKALHCWAPRCRRSAARAGPRGGPHAARTSPWALPLCRGRAHPVDQRSPQGCRRSRGPRNKTLGLRNAVGRTGIESHIPVPSSLLPRESALQEPAKHDLPTMFIYNNMLFVRTMFGSIF